MLRLVTVVLVLLVAFGALSYWRGWFSVTNEGKVEVQVDSSKFKQDKEAFSKSVGEKANTMKTRLANLWEKTEGLTGNDKVIVQTELGELKEKRDRLEGQINELENANQDRFESIRRDLSKTLDEVEKKIDELTKKMDKGKNS
jgi:hypothetical protein